MILLDTHIAYWLITDDEKMPESAKSLIKNNNRIYFSVISMWEIELKHQKNPEKMPLTGKQFYLACIEAGLMCLSIRPRHVFQLDNLLSESNYHNDPFDHLLLATTIEEKCLFLTHDEKMRHYKNVDVIIC